MRASGRIAWVVALGLVPIVAATTSQAAVYRRDKTRARVAAHYVVSQQASNGSITGFSQIGSTSDAIVALVAAKRGRGAIRDALGYLRRHVADIDTVGEKAKVIQALVAAGKSPRDFKHHNFVKGIKKQELDGGHYGQDTQVFDQADAMIALLAAGDTPSAAAKRWLEDAQCRDGGWQFDKPSSKRDDRHCSTGGSGDFTTSDTNTTSLASQALGSSDQGLKASPFRFFARARDPKKHGWGYAKGYVTDTNSTALVIQAYAAAGRVLPSGAKKALRKIQYPLCKQYGAFPFDWQDDDHNGTYRRSGPDVGATIQGILGLLEQPYPVPAANVTRSAHVSFAAC
jgi:hypothetical protein